MVSFVKWHVCCEKPASYSLAHLDVGWVLLFQQFTSRVPHRLYKLITLSQQQSSTNMAHNSKVTLVINCKVWPPLAIAR